MERIGFNASNEASGDPGGHHIPGLKGVQFYDKSPHQNDKVFLVKLPLQLTDGKGNLVDVVIQMEKNGAIPTQEIADAIGMDAVRVAVAIREFLMENVGKALPLIGVLYTLKEAKISAQLAKLAMRLLHDTHQINVFENEKKEQVIQYRRPS